MDLKYKKGYVRIDEAFVKECDREFDDVLNNTVETVCHDNSVKIIGITGPTCSGKTTTAKKVIGYYESHGIKLHVISLDDFFKDQFSKDDFIDPKNVDFDSPDTFDTDLFYSFVTDLFQKGVAQKPIFNFQTGDREVGERIVMGEGDVLLFEGIQLLYPQVEAILHKMHGRSIYICPESGIQIGDVCVTKETLRLMRRLVRDCNFRAADPLFTLDLWASVRRNEDANIFPHAHKCDVRIDTTQRYELNILKPYLEKILPHVECESEYYELIEGMLSAVSGIESISRDTLSETSLYNEFV